MKSYWLLGGILAGGLWVAGILASLFYFGFLRLNYPSPETYPITGIDISHHQGQIDWQALAQEEFRFVYIKATEGGDFRDQMFAANWQAASQIGLVKGAYHFYRPCKTGQEQAQNFIATVPLEKNTLPPVIDLEFSESCTPAKTNAQILNEIKAYHDIIETHYGQRPVIYTTYEFYEIYLDKQFLETPLWIRDIVSKPALNNGRDWLFWQFSSRGRVNGIEAYVDLNVFKGSTAAFQQLVQVTPPPTP